MNHSDAVLILWEYLSLHQTPEPADCIIGFGCYNEDIARRAAQLYHMGFAPLVLFSGGLGRNTSSMWKGSTEAQHFAEVAKAEGVPDEVILLENQSANSAENLLFCKALLTERGMNSPRILAVHKPYMERRLAAAFPVYWPEAHVKVTSWQQDYDTYVMGLARWNRTEADTIHMLVGDFARISRYSELGYQVPQQIPEEAWEAYDILIHEGYIEQLPK